MVSGSKAKLCATESEEFLPKHASESNIRVTDDGFRKPVELKYVAKE